MHPVQYLRWRFASSRYGLTTGNNTDINQITQRELYDMYHRKKDEVSSIISIIVSWSIRKNGWYGAEILPLKPPSGDWRGGVQSLYEVKDPETVPRVPMVAALNRSFYKVIRLPIQICIITVLYLVRYLSVCQIRRIFYIRDIVPGSGKIGRLHRPTPPWSSTSKMSLGYRNLDFEMLLSSYSGHSHRMRRSELW